MQALASASGQILWPHRVRARQFTGPHRRQLKRYFFLIFSNGNTDYQGEFFDRLYFKVLVDRLHVMSKTIPKTGHGTIVIEGFPGMGGVSSITSKYIIDFFRLKKITTLDLDSMPPVTIVRNRRPVPAVSVYGGTLPTGRKVAVIHSEIPAPEKGIRKIASEISHWAKSINASLLLSAQGMVVERETADLGEIGIYGTSSSARGERMLKNAGINIMEEGVVTGIPGLLLAEGARRNLTTVTLLAESGTSHINPGSAALMIHAIDVLCLNSNVDCGPICSLALESINVNRLSIRKELGDKELLPGLVYR
jgi:uncharacterized protein